ncbi:MAG: SAM-dependent methyltransferase, partial [Betaproteobacteria bacterium]
MDASSGTAAGVSTTLADWFRTDLGRYLLAREQAYFDQTVADIFG